MSTHLFGAVVTGYGTAANNRGDSEGGNTATLQKLLWRDELHTTVSAEAIRWALRHYWQRQSAGDKRLKTNRRWDDELQDNVIDDPSWRAWTAGAVHPADTLIDDDVLGFMLAEGARAEGDETEGSEAHGKAPRRPRAKGTSTRRRGALEVTRAVSTTPYAGDMTFNARSGARSSTSLYSLEVHATRYQYGFALTPASLAVPWRALAVLDALVNLCAVAGNHSRFLYDFSPSSVVFRVTDDMAPRILYCFEDIDGSLELASLVARVKAGDVLASELVVGGEIALRPSGVELKELGAWVDPGVKRAAAVTRLRLAARDDLKEALAEPAR